MVEVSLIRAPGNVRAFVGRSPRTPLNIRRREAAAQVREGLVMVKNGRATIPKVPFVMPRGNRSGIEVMTLADLSARMRRHGGPEGARDAAGSGRAQRPEFHLLLTVDQGLLWHMVDFTDYAVTDHAW